MAWESGQVVGAYRIEERIGSGGMATVYRAHHERLGRDVAIKVMHPAHATDADFLSRFEREARIVARLEHPNIVPVYDFDEVDGQPYLVMKYVHGQTLKDKFAEQPPTLDEIVRVTDALADALAYAHGEGVLHRDIKPSNVILDEQGTPNLTDFGLARVLQAGESSMSAGMIVGTPNYIAPEQASGEQPVTERSDVYALGVMLYEMVVGRVPFTASSPFATVHQQIYEPPPLPSELNPEVPTQVEMVLLRALEKDPDDRYESPAALAKAFKQAVSASGLTALSPERSSVVAQSAAATPRRKSQDDDPPQKPKREPTGDSNGPLLLLDDEENWSNLPQDEIIRRRLKKRRGEQIGLLFHALPYIGVNAVIIMGVLSDGEELIGAFITPLAWGAGLAAHATHVYYQSSRKIEELYSGFNDTMTDEYGVGWRRTLEDSVILAAWRQAKDTYSARREFRIHSAVFTLINIMLWSIWVNELSSSGQLEFPWPAIVTVMWGAGLAGHGVYTRYTRGSRDDEQSIAAEMAIMDGSSSRTPRQQPRKRKNDDAPAEPDVRLTDDGEFTDSMVSDIEREQRNTRRG